MAILMEPVDMIGLQFYRREEVNGRFIARRWVGLGISADQSGLVAKPSSCVGSYANTVLTAQQLETECHSTRRECLETIMTHYEEQHDYEGVVFATQLLDDGFI